MVIFLNKYSCNIVNSYKNDDLNIFISSLGLPEHQPVAGRSLPFLFPLRPLRMVEGRQRGGGVEVARCGHGGRQEEEAERELLEHILIYNFGN